MRKTSRHSNGFNFSIYLTFATSLNTNLYLRLLIKTLMMLFWINPWIIITFSAAVNVKPAEAVPQWRADLQIHNGLSSVPLDCTYHAPLSFSPHQKKTKKKPWADTLNVTFSLAHILKEKGDLFQKAVFKSFYTQFFDLNPIYHFQELKAKVTELTFPHTVLNENGHNLPKSEPANILTNKSWEWTLQDTILWLGEVISRSLPKCWHTHR